MKILILLLILSSFLRADIAPVQDDHTNGGNVTTLGVAFGSTVTAGSGRYILVSLAWGDSANTSSISQVTDNASPSSNTYTCQAKQRNATLGVSTTVCQAPITNGGTLTVTADWAGTTDQTYSQLAIIEVSGGDTSTPFDNCSALFQDTGTGYTSTASVTTSRAGGFLISMYAGSGTPAAGTGWTAINSTVHLYRTAATATSYPALRTDVGSQTYLVSNCAWQAPASAATARRRVIVVQ